MALEVQIKVGQVWHTYNGDVVLIIGRTKHPFMPFRAALLRKDVLHLWFWMTDEGSPEVSDRSDNLSVLVDDGTGPVAMRLKALAALETRVSDHVRGEEYVEAIC